MDRVTRLAAVALCLAGLPLRDTAPSGTYELRRVAGKPLPAVYGGAADSAKAGVTLLGAAVTFGPRGDSAVVSVTVRPRMLEDWPCAALRAMRADEGRGGTGGMTAAPDTASAGCDPLRLEHDTTRVGVRPHGDSLELRPDPRASQLPPLRGTLRQDTLRLRMPAGPADSLEVWTFVRSVSRPST